MSRDYAYVAIKPCGCAVAAAVDWPELKSDTAKDIAKWIRDGYSVERWTLERTRADIKSCKCAKAEGRQP